MKWWKRLLLLLVVFIVLCFSFTGCKWLGIDPDEALPHYTKEVAP